MEPIATTTAAAAATAATVTITATTITTIIGPEFPLVSFNAPDYFVDWIRNFVTLVSGSSGRT